MRTGTYITVSLPIVDSEVHPYPLLSHKRPLVAFTRGLLRKEGEP